MFLFWVLICARDIIRKAIDQIVLLESPCVTPDRVRNRVNLSSSDISDSVVTEFIINACAEIMAETSLTIDHSNCRVAEAKCVTDLAALYCIVYLTGGSAAGTSFTLGDRNVKQVRGSPILPPDLLQKCVLKMIEALKTSDFRVASA